MTETTLSRRKKARNDLTAEFVRSFLDYDPETGIFIWKYNEARSRRINMKCVGKVAGCIDSRGYIRIGVCGALYLAHRLAWLCAYGTWPASEIDHIDGNPSNNKISNLRMSTISENNCNRRSGQGRYPKGVGVFHRNGNTYVFAHIKKFGKSIHLGMFNTVDEAHIAYCEAAPKIHGEFARTE